MAISENPFTAAQLNVGQKGVIKGFTDVSMSLKLLEMGCIPGIEIEMDSLAPLGCPVNLKVGNYRLSLRKSEAATILLQIKNV
jgi:ferrous iron transport protein A